MSFIVVKFTNYKTYYFHNIWLYNSCRRKCKPTPVFMPGDFHGQRSLQTIVHGVTNSQTWLKWLQLSSVQSLSHVPLFVTHGLKHARPPCPSPTPWVDSNSSPLSQWCYPTISFSVVPFSSHLQSFPASEPFPMSQLFTWGGQSIGVSASASVFPMNIQDWFPSGWTSWISLQCKGLSRVFSNTTVQKHQFFYAQLSLESNSHIHTWLLEKP